MRGLSPRIGALRESPTRKIDELRERLRREKRDVILLSTGQPSIPPPREVREAMAELLKVDSMELYGYTPSQGIYETREAISEDLKKLGGLEVSPEQIVLTAGGQAAMFSTLAVLIEPGDEVVVMDPTYFGYRPLLEYFGAVVKTAGTRLEKGFQPEVEVLKSVVSRRTKAMIIVTPDNPTGRVLREDVARAIADLARDFDFWILTDEAYKTLIYEGNHVYFYKLAPERTISINTFSKDPAIPGWRLGYVYGPAEVMPKIKLVNEEMVYCPPSFAQRLVALYLRSEVRMRYIREVVEIYRQKRDVAVTALRKYIPEAKFAVPAGSMFIFVDLSRYLNDSESFARDLLERHGVAVVPGSYFSEYYKAAVRISFVTETPQRIDEGIRRIGEALNA
ncbi:MAG: pyridoxal phosphate-dependent aminotransferase [Pyrobaculum sp.]|uniref:Aminotransferase n=2 Tax=Pyrobaculum arsenaticum TaxID=121277 RepID=A4WM38_PYRAR|nr:pyridoxal phosphate-dependent aminotransferase [Pyrobaculum arsenaticum]ABP51455.1 aminotransferase [Pyrobaculum arsenaticum DSM 13514]MCY0890926.1 pyridoxal phosphate-dependent aminotransferase [Pyrobaculum arsenaticum]NYR16580.1 pyridoxal phosphate-dependent aminotransferase [Pyrobaculum arsenaticum]